MIGLDDPKPFWKRYQRIPPHQYKEVKKHQKKIVEIGAIRKWQSPWSRAVVLVRKKTGELRFCIDWWKLNAKMVKDGQTSPQITDSLDCLNCAIIFTSLDLKSGYWQVELDTESIPYKAFTVGHVGFYKCLQMPFSLTNAPATFQHLRRLDSFDCRKLAMYMLSNGKIFLLLLCELFLQFHNNLHLDCNTVDFYKYSMTFYMKDKPKRVIPLIIPEYFK